MATRISSSNAIGRGKGKRCRSGCWTCREAGYKCDEAKPFCGRCVRLKRSCQGYGLRLKWRHHKESRSKIDPRPPPNHAFHDAQLPAENNATQSIIASSYTDFATSSPSLVLPASPGLSISGNSVIDSIATPTGFQSCELPSTISIVPLGEDSPPRSGSEISFQPDNCPEKEQSSVVQLEPAFWASYLCLDDYRLLHHFNTVVSTLLSVTPNGNPFQKHFVSMALQKGPLQSVILSVAASHLSAVLPHKDTRVITDKHHRFAIQSLSSALVDPVERLSDTTLAAILMLQIRRQFVDHVVEADDCHLSAARELIQLRGGPSAMSASCSKFLLGLFNYHDILGSIAHSRAPFIFKQHGYDTISSLLGEASSILHIASGISVLQPMKNGTMKASEADIQSLVQTLELQLETWRVPAEAAEDADVANTAAAYQAAASIYLFRVAYNIGAPHPRTLHRVHLCLDALSKVPVTSPLVSMHVWPLFTGGCEAVDPQDRQFAIHRFDEMYNHRGMYSLIRVREAMETVWKCKDLEGGDNRPDLMVKLGCLEALGYLGLSVDLV
ncbi:Zn2Cys6 [Trichoderma simmonsii]|uniref:Zn2Cys6 n=1 Tax=Trichoderma simmonsii TaxID=1491479 RepID=A0A8G0PA97_9HYPO|nr:Zn2Cys6 [Trichoderma simmonsii]